VKTKISNLVCAMRFRRTITRCGQYQNIGKPD